MNRQTLIQAAATLQEYVASLPDSDPRPAPNYSGLVTESLLSESTGFSVSRLETMRRRGDVVENVHWFTNPKSAIVWDKEAFEQWQMGIPAVDTKAYKFEKTGLSVYASSTAANGSGKVSNLKPVLPASKAPRNSVKRSSTGTD